MLKLCIGGFGVKYFFSSRRRHTRSLCDWSSDVCSSDLVVLGVDHHHFEDILDDHKDRNGYELDTDLSADDWAVLVDRYKEGVEEELGEPFPQDPAKQDRKSVV